VGSSVNSASQATPQLSGERESPAVAPSIEEIVDQIRRIESSNGTKGLAVTCKLKGLSNDYGYNPPNCYPEGVDREKSMKRIAELMKKYTLEETLCGYNLGFNHKNFQDCLNQSEDFPYLRDFYSI